MVIEHFHEKKFFASSSGKEIKKETISTQIIQDFHGILLHSLIKIS